MTGSGSAQGMAWPEAWRGSRAKAVVKITLLVLVAIAGVLAGVATIETGPVRGLLMVVGSPMFGLFAGFFYITRLRRSRGAPGVRSEYLDHVGERAVVVPYARWTFWFNLSVMMYGLLFSVALLVLGVVRGSGRGFDIVALGMVVVGAVLTALMGWLLVEVALGRVVRGCVALAPSGVYQRSWSMEGFYPWGESVGVRASQRQEPVIELLFPSDGSVRVRSLSRVWRDMRYAPNLVVRARWLTVDPALVLAAMDFYQQHPEHRPELGGAAGVERIRQHQFS